MNVSLVMYKADGHHREFPLRKPRTVIGRRDTCDLRVPLGSVSRQHCEILFDPPADDQQPDESAGPVRLTLRDLESSNGTYHNHEKVTEAQLAAGDEVAIGPVVFVVVIDGQPKVTVNGPRRVDFSNDAEPSHDSAADFAPDAPVTVPSAATLSTSSGNAALKRLESLVDIESQR